MAADKKKSVLKDILKREKLDKLLNREKKVDIAKVATQAIKVKSEEKSSSSVGQAKDINNQINAAKANTSFDQAADDVSIDIRYYFLKEENYFAKFKELYLTHKDDFFRYGITAKKFIEYSRESFDRYKKIQKQMPLEPMKPKAFTYVQSSVNDLVKMLAQKFGK